jgi:hypothetical protein
LPITLLDRDVSLERRTKRRFQIEQAVSYRLVDASRGAQTGVGQTVNVSSGGVLFTTQTELERGVPMELTMSWPALVGDVCPLKLMIYGCVVRSKPGHAAMVIERWEFRTRGSSPLPAFEGPAVRLPA